MHKGSRLPTQGEACLAEHDPRADYMGRGKVGGGLRFILAFYALIVECVCFTRERGMVLEASFRNLGLFSNSD